MGSFTPQKDANATVYAAMKEGLISGGLAGEGSFCTCSLFQLKRSDV